MIEELGRTEQLVYVDTALPKPEQEDNLGDISSTKPIDQERILERRTRIAEKAYGFLKQLKVPQKALFTDPSYYRHLKTKE